jgi:phage tail-like protein
MASYYPPVGFHFNVSFDLPGAGSAEVHFQQVSGISMELQVETLNEGGENRFSHKFPVRPSYPDLVLKRGLLVDSGVRSWCESAIRDFDIQPTTVWVTVMNENHEPLQTYTFFKAWPKKWSVSDLNAESSSLLIESLELAYQYFKIEN